MKKANESDSPKEVREYINSINYDDADAVSLVAVDLDGSDYSYHKLLEIMDIIHQECPDDIKYIIEHGTVKQFAATLDEPDKTTDASYTRQWIVMVWYSTRSA